MTLIRDSGSVSSDLSTMAGEITLNSGDSRRSLLPATEPPFDHDRRGPVRSLCESLISLFIAVLLFRTFAAEGYMISTGSMAPCLLGYHKRVECPTCGHLFPFGVAYDTDSPDDYDELDRSRSRAICPNCGQTGIDISEVPRNHGDQLLVNKQAYGYRLPQRWEIVVFRNPAMATEAYVKRVVGLPGEHLQVSDGDLLIDGQLICKDLARQREMRILVNDHNYRPREKSGYRVHWWPMADDAMNMRETRQPGGWRVDGDGFILRQGNERRPDHEPFRWVQYHHWVRLGGYHDTSVPLEEWPPAVEVSAVPSVGLRYDPQLKQLSCTGALPEVAMKEILALSDDEIFRSAIRQLYEASHVAPITDVYGYNPYDGSHIPNAVRDVMVSCRTRIEGGSGEFAIQMSDGVRNYAFVMDASRRECRLLVGDSEEPVIAGDWPKSLDAGAAVIEASLIDRQFIVAVNGQMVLRPWPTETPDGTPAPRSAVRIGGRGLDVTIDELKVYRDVYYTSARARNGVNRPFVLEDNQYFVLGDNSPVSHDSRRWDDAPVDRKLLLGKPFLVHLPSKPGRLRIGGRELHLRMPDTERIRFLK